MATKTNTEKVLTFKVSQLIDFNTKLRQATDAYINQVTRSAEMWINRSGGYDYKSFVHVTLQLDQTMMFVMEKTGEMEGELVSLLSSSSDPATPPADPTSAVQTETGRKEIVPFHLKEKLSDWDYNPVVSATSSVPPAYNIMLDKLDDRVTRFGERLSNMEKVFDEGINKIKGMEEALQQVQVDCAVMKDKVEAEKLSNIKEVFDEGLNKIKGMEEALQQVQVDCAVMKDKVEAEKLAVAKKERGSASQELEQGRSKGIAEKIESLIQVANTLVTKLDMYRSVGHISHIGFTACLENRNIIPGSQYTFMAFSTRDEHFNRRVVSSPETVAFSIVDTIGFQCDPQFKFSATVSGTYEVTITLRITGGILPFFQVVHENGNPTPETWTSYCVCRVWMKHGQNECTATKVIKMVVGDKVFVKEEENKEYINNSNTTFNNQSKGSLFGTNTHQNTYYSIPIFSCVLLE